MLGTDAATIRKEGKALGLTPPAPLSSEEIRRNVEIVLRALLVGQPDGLTELRYAFARPRAPSVNGPRRLCGIRLQHRDVEALAGQHHRGAQADDATPANNDRAHAPVTLVEEIEQ